MWLFKVFLFVALFYCTFAGDASEEEGDLFEGDMELDPAQLKAYKTGNAFGARIHSLWKDSRGNTERIYYYISRTISSKGRTAIEDALDELEDKTCLRFYRKSSRPSGYHLYFRNYPDRCSSPVGRRSGGNEIKLKTTCYNKGNVVHEIMHSLGFYHEQSRPDRDNYVTINYNNIKDGKEHNFKKRKYSEVDSRGYKYDYRSVMHYRGASFSRTGGDTIVTKDRYYQRKIGQREGLSSGDVNQLNAIYCKRPFQ